MGTGTDVAASVSITGNSISVYASMLLRTHRGIFVGNCDNVVIEANRLEIGLHLVRKGSTVENGIRIFGWLGPLVIARHNRLTGFSAPGIDSHQLGQPPPNQLLLLNENVIE
jgi:hypothetical protein